MARRMGRRYPWAEWFSERKVILKKGVDYNGQTMSMVVLIKQAAKRPAHNVKIGVKVSPDETTITLRVIRDYERTEQEEVMAARIEELARPRMAKLAKLNPKPSTRGRPKKPPEPTT